VTGMRIFVFQPAGEQKRYCRKEEEPQSFHNAVCLVAAKANDFLVDGLMG
jgi:hypothetical protein